MDWFVGCLRKYAVVEGRARRKEYWMFFLVWFLLFLGITFGAASFGMVDEEGNSLPGTIYYLATVVPGIAAGVRRMHDTDRSGWWLIVPIANILFAVQEGTRGPNRFGPDPKLAERQTG